jgi:site-specific DNA-methyltransferase (adenine-specific)
MSTRIVAGEVAEALRAMPAGSFDACLCDPPYGLTANKQGGSGVRSINLRHPAGRARIGAGNGPGGFMGMRWDDRVPGPEVWAKVLRVLKPGAPLLAFGGPRTFHRLACALEDAGFLIGDTLCWLYGQGFPKGGNLKPAWEPITLAWKPGKKRPLAINTCRIPGPKGNGVWGSSNRNCKPGFIDSPGRQEYRSARHDSGRWPANVILDPQSAAELDAQTGTLHSGGFPDRRHADKTRNTWGKFNGHQCPPGWKNDAGGASRFFYCAKASKKERGEGNTHPTVKPVKLCEYLARLILPPSPDARLLVPFAGSGSEVLGARRAGWKEIVAIEREPAYLAIAERRLAA